ncbi:hypothetical protein K2173_010152 (mitochondrion) [Erythroxylum novogranatense]|uniref:Uncharacterized protein n=1 Tax=Erythroxylum novogranatense TaxID=1862640 RepID=A0AAV8S491_9ROSI|nr:hypothetical protein K2173_010152 [Erythroxylum novogranatense]
MPLREQGAKEVGCSSTLAFVLVFAVRAMITGVASDIGGPQMMMPSGSDIGGPQMMMPSGSGSEVSSSEASVNQTGAGPSNARTDDSSSAPSAFEERTNELIQENLKERKGDLGDGQRVSEVRQAVEEDFEIGTKAEEFTLIKEFEAEAQGGSKRNIQEDLPATKSVFNQVK